MRKRIFSVAMALCMVLGLLPATAWAEADSSVSEVYIGGTAESGGVKLDNDTPYYHNGESGAKGTANTNPDGANATFHSGTLTLNGLDIRTDKVGIWWQYNDSGKHDLIIDLNGTDNTVKNTAESGDGIAINGASGFSNDGPSLTIKNSTGNGTLTAEGYKHAIWVWHNITIENNAVVNATSKLPSNEECLTIATNDSFGSVIMKGNALVTADGGAYGIGDSNNKNTIKISGNAVVVAQGNKAAFKTDLGVDLDISDYSSDKRYASIALENEPFVYYDTTNISTYKYVIFGDDVPGGSNPTPPATQTHYICGEADCSEHGAALTWTAVSTADELKSAATNGGSVYLANDITLSEDLTTDDSVDFNLCLNGHVLNLDGHVIKVMSRGDGTKKTNLCDCQNTAHKFKVEDGKWVLDEEHGTEAVQGGVITGGSNQGINVNGGFDMYGGNIVGNEATNGGGVYVTDGTFNMYGGNIKGNKATNGGGVYVDSVFNMYGGSITDNTATGNGGGVYDYGMLDVSGDVNISGNKKGDDANNVYLPSGKTIKIDGALDSSVIIGVTTEAIPAGNSSVGITNTYNALDYNRNFVSDNTTYKTFRDTYNKIRLGVEGDAPTAYEVRVTPNSAECGSVDISGTVDSSGNYSAGTPVRVTAIPKVDARKAHRFVGWYWDNSTTLVSTNNPYTFNVTGTAKLRTEFEEIPVGTLQISASPDSMRGAGTVTLTVVNNTGDPSVNVTCNNDITVTGAGNTRSAYLPNQTQTYTFTAEAGGQSATCTVDVRKKSSSSSDSSSGGSSNEKPEEKPVEKPEEKPEEVPKDNEIVLTIGEKVTVVFGDPVVNDVAPILRNDRAMLPIRFVVEALGGTVTWNEAQQSVTCVKGDNTITIYIGHPFALVNGNPVELDSPAFIENDRTYLPIRFIAENLDAAVTWNADAQEVTFVPNK